MVVVVVVVVVVGVGGSVYLYVNLWIFIVYKFYQSESFLNSLNIFVLHIFTLYIKIIYIDVRKVPENSDSNCML